jgi:acyl carrier protein
VMMNFIMTDIAPDDDDSLADEGIIDSTGIVELVLFLEETFQMDIPEDDVLPEQFDSIGRLADYVLARQERGTRTL